MTTDTFTTCYGCRRPLRLEDVFCVTVVDGDGHWFVDDLVIPRSVEVYFCRDCLDHPAVVADYARAMRVNCNAALETRINIFAECHPTWTVTEIARALSFDIDRARAGLEPWFEAKARPNGGPPGYPPPPGAPREAAVRAAIGADIVGDSDDAMAGHQMVVFALTASGRRGSRRVAARAPATRLTARAKPMAE